jgi:predicted SnoaL-like aldol condensation-catalyzing enzyme
MTKDDMKALVARMYAAANSGNIDEADHIFAADFHSHPLGTTGVEPIKDAWRAILAKHPDLHAVVEDLLVDGDRIAVRSTVRGTTGDDRPHPTIMEMIRVEDGRIAELWGISNLDLR